MYGQNNQTPEIIITGSLDNISKPLAQKLIAEGHEVTVISSQADQQQEITALGAKEAVGAVEDATLADGAAAGCPYAKSTLFLLKLQEAGHNDQAKNMIFITGTWSRCPAEQRIPAVISGAWKRTVNSPPRSVGETGGGG